jgi:hypothetical protein
MTDEERKAKEEERNRLAAEIVPMLPEKLLGELLEAAITAHTEYTWDLRSVVSEAVRVRAQEMLHTTHAKLLDQAAEAALRAVIEKWCLR